MYLSKKTFLAYSYFIIVTCMYGFSFTKLDITGGLHDVLLISSLLIASLSFVVDAYSSKMFSRLIIIGVLSLLVYFSSHETLYILMVWSAIMIKDIGYDKALKIIFYIRLIMFAIVLICVLFGIIGIEKTTVSKGLYGQVVAYGLGYSHPNNLGQEIFYLSTLFLCIKNEKIKNQHFIYLIIIDIITYAITGSKTPCSLLLILILILFVFKNFSKQRLYTIYSKVCLTLSVILPIFGTVLPVIMLNSSGKLRQIIYLLNGKLNQRISNSSMMYRSFPITLFGKIIDLEYLKKHFGYNVVDNGYTFALFNFGIIGFGLMALLYFLSIKILIKKKQVVYFSVITMTLCFAIMENILRAMYMNFCMLFWWEVISIGFLKSKQVGEINNDT